MEHTDPDPPVDEVALGRALDRDVEGPVGRPRDGAAPDEVVAVRGLDVDGEPGRVLADVRMTEGRRIVPQRSSRTVTCTADAISSAPQRTSARSAPRSSAPRDRPSRSPWRASTGHTSATRPSSTTW